MLVSSVAFELMDEAYKIGGLDAAAPGLLLGAAVFYLADREVTRRGGGRRKNSGTRRAGLPPPSGRCSTAYRSPRPSGSA